jgi:hypothetical protein
VEECRPCPVFVSFTLAFALQLRKKHGKTSVRVRKTSVTVQYSYLRCERYESDTHYKYCWDPTILKGTLWRPKHFFAVSHLQVGIFVVPQECDTVNVSYNPVSFVEISQEIRSLYTKNNVLLCLFIYHHQRDSQEDSCSACDTHVDWSTFSSYLDSHYRDFHETSNHILSLHSLYMFQAPFKLV